jgi:hypothetical protein
MTRLDIERQNRLEPIRIKKALDEFLKIGLKVISHNENVIRFYWSGSVINYFPYSGWASGKTIKDGRGLKKLLKQLVNKELNE